MEQAKPKPSFFQQAAQASWLAPVVAIGANLMLRNLDQPAERVAISGMLLLVLYGLGFFLGLLALTGIRTHGRRGILVPALIGVVANAGILALGVFVATAA
jgi:hypothetical protein